MTSTPAVRADRAAIIPRTALVPGGWFLMGSAEGRPDESPVHQVFVSAFDLALTPVTTAQYSDFLAVGRCAQPPFLAAAGFGCGDQPVVGVTWHEANAYAQWLSDEVGDLWRLPTEAEWERAARGGLEGAPTSWGGELPPGEVPFGPLTGPWDVGHGRPNGYGLLDIGTIVHEWCLDWYGVDYYRDSPEENPPGPAEGERRASRGGSWRHHVRWSPPAARSSLPPDFRYADYGFRVLRERR